MTTTPTASAAASGSTSTAADGSALVGAPPHRVASTRDAMIGMDGVEGEELARTCCRNVAETFASELETLDSKIARLARSRDTVRNLLARARHAEVLGHVRLVLGPLTP